MNRFFFPSLSLAVFFTASLLVESGAQEAEEGSPLELAPLTVIGSKEHVERLPGSAAFLDVEDIRSQGYDDINQVIRQVPGVYFRQEDGFGLFPNISFRGVGSMRTNKLTVMEDGILSAPAPYANPSAYYTPTVGRMSGVEILKGSSQVKYGPQTTGGVLNYLSTPVPSMLSGYIRGTYGENNEIRVHAYTGNTVETAFGNVGFLFENFHRTTDGFKSIDETPDFRRGSETGFTKNEPMLKLAWEPSTSNYQRWELKLGYTDMDADEGYLGLTDDDFDRDPFRRYSGSRFDNIDTSHVRASLRHVFEPTPESRIVTTGYFNRFERAWFKLHEVSTDPSFDATRPGSRLGLSEAIAEEGAHLAVLRGEQEGTLRYRNNARDYDSYGIEQNYLLEVEAGALVHQLEAGVRLHHDFENRFQNETNFNQQNNGAIDGTFEGVPGSQDNRKGEATAFALFFQDRISWDRWSVTPGVRYEHVRLKNTRRQTNPAAPDFGDVTATRRATLDVIAPGIGANFDTTEKLSFFGGVFRGFSLPGPSAATNPANPLEEETSIGYELGSRYNDRNGFQAELVLFHTDFDNLIVPDNIGGAGTGQSENVGKARTSGVEISLAYDPGVAHGWAFRNPNRVAFTYTDARIRNDVEAAGGGGGAVESIFAGGKKGNRLPYVPEYQISAGTGIEYGKWGVYLDGFYVPDVYGTANNTDNLRRGRDADGPLDARFGKIDSYFLLDVAVHYHVSEHAKLFAGVQNLLNEEYIASRLPHGPRPGAPRFAHLGMEITF